MDEHPELVLKKLCCTCLSQDRKLFQLCRINNGVNNFYLLLSNDPEAYREGFYKEMASLFVCWECRAIMCKMGHFRRQACVAQKQLALLTEGLIDLFFRVLKYEKKFHLDVEILDLKWQHCTANMALVFKPNSTPFCVVIHERQGTRAIFCKLIKTQNSLSHLSIHHTSSFQSITSIFETVNDNFIDCGPPTDIKCESEEDIPLSELHSNWNTDNVDKNGESCYENGESYYENGEYRYDNGEGDYDNEERCNNGELKELVYKKRKKVQNKKNILENSKEYFNVIILNEEEIKKMRIDFKTAPKFMAAEFKCENCLILFKNTNELEEHNLILHNEKPNHTKCDICSTYVKLTSYKNHRNAHFERYNCVLCKYIVYDINTMLLHIKDIHGIKNVKTITSKKNKTTEPKECSGKVKMDKRSPLGYLCSECNVYFENKNQRWKHVQRTHRSGYECSTCGKRFAFTNNLTRHQLLHQGPPPREECPTCHKMIRTDLMKVHCRIHSTRERFYCALCAKCFVSRASYEHHLKYTQPHATTPAVLRYKCNMCDKGYRSRGELRDHVNYQHMGRTQHKCPICGKALATRRCITRHVRRAHEGVKESPRDKICQQCGKAFRDKKGLREHELIHTGERPLSCELCGCTFRQSASLYTHRKRVHKIYPNKKTIELLEV